MRRNKRSLSIIIANKHIFTKMLRVVMTGKKTDRLGEAGGEGAGGYEAIPTTGESATLLTSVNSRGIASRKPMNPPAGFAMTKNDSFLSLLYPKMDFVKF